MALAKDSLTTTDYIALSLFYGLRWQYRSGTGLRGIKARVSTLKKLIRLGYVVSMEKEDIPPWETDRTLYMLTSAGESVYLARPNIPEIPRDIMP